ncbi:hypothetical protein Dtox_3049 [Desulfofarcimen acetoxidans DSM 771]|jgi:hypothetical protein|uniref:DUF4342 domain-containing protein n=1 Tax=Desulfofarcimen acetoxidans (strain ATCC 49208 / DSM 771 / KCTC 5769 / VKM B-1644 / 5575) TaxID=485916 RepID=C8W3L5_DESAS|nr:DUF4342 domain-containing protein [Desulfofarcimen acetoxidans]ACV63801.1 hypothetical protein Dtox_3049 [Desulfofarcimen acetoxidans DSM 771]
MTSELEKIDLLRARTGISYKEAQEALGNVNGDVVEALINIEEKNRRLAEKMQIGGQNAMSKLKSLINKGQDTKIRLIKDEQTVMEIPATLGVLGLIGVIFSSELALLGAVGTMSAVANKYTMEIDYPRADDTEDELMENIH